ncbi:MAG TPA: hypothetical protein VHY21_01445 [Pseudonocardiaceae bacterium]|jgi:hypothetical protein|nr:hypothetical protein [Pseudonocardiaceae bacterium]
MTTSEKRSTGTDYNDRDSHRERDSHQHWDGHHRHAGVPTAARVMGMWTVASYDYALQVLKAQQQFAHSMLTAAAPMLHLARDLSSADTEEGRSAHHQLGYRSDQGHDRSHGSQENERYSDEDTAEYNNRFADNNRSDDNDSDTNKTERANTQAEGSAKTRARGAASTPGRKLS